MREILFRGKRFDNGEWAYGYFIASVLKGSVFGYIKQSNTADDVKVYKKTVGQFTGLYDKNGTKIFEGDIVKGKDYLEEGLEVYGYIDHRNGSFVIVGNFLIHYRWLDYEVEVIGNIHDNRLEDFNGD